MGAWGRCLARGAGCGRKRVRCERGHATATVADSACIGAERRVVASVGVSSTSAWPRGVSDSGGHVGHGISFQARGHGHSRG